MVVIFAEGVIIKIIIRMMVVDITTVGAMMCMIILTIIVMNMAMIMVIMMVVVDISMDMKKMNYGRDGNDQNKN